MVFWNISLAEEVPSMSLLYLLRSSWVLMVVITQDSLYNSIWLLVHVYPWLRSNFEKYSDHPDHVWSYWLTFLSMFKWTCVSVSFPNPWKKLPYSLRSLSVCSWPGLFFLVAAQSNTCIFYKYISTSSIYKRTWDFLTSLFSELLGVENLPDKHMLWTWALWYPSYLDALSNPIHGMCGSSGWSFLHEFLLLPHLLSIVPPLG